MLRKSAVILPTLLLVLSLLAGCGKAEGDSYSGNNGISMDSVASSERREPDLGSAAKAARKLIRTISVSAQTKKHDDLPVQKEEGRPKPE